MVGPKVAANGVPKARGEKRPAEKENCPPGKRSRSSDVAERPSSLVSQVKGSLQSALTSFRDKAVDLTNGPKTAAEANGELIRKRHRRDQLIKEVDQAEMAVRVLERRELERRNQNLSKALECERQKRREAEKLATSPFPITGNNDQRPEEEQH